jgi:hypothetical protein
MWRAKLGTFCRMLKRFGEWQYRFGRTIIGSAQSLLV